jgi:DNA-entry nuclease
MSRNDGNNPFFELLGMLLIPAIVFSIVMSVDSPNAKMEKQVNQTYEISSIADETKEIILEGSTIKLDSDIEVESIEDLGSEASLDSDIQNATVASTAVVTSEESYSAILTAADVPLYTGEDEAILNNGKNTFTTAELKYQGVGWAIYGDLDDWNRVTTMDAMVTPNMYDTGTDADSRILPTGWKKSEQNAGNPEQLNRGHLLADVLGGSGEDWRNLVTLYRNANYPTMYFAAEDIVKTAIQHGSVVRYRVTPIFVGEELMCEGMHIMAKSVTDNSVDLNVYVFNEPKDDID